MLRWILLVCALVMFAAAFKIDSPGLLAAILVVAFVAAIASFIGFLSERVDSVAQGQSSRELELLLTARRKPGGPAPAAGGGRNPARDSGGSESFLYASMAGASVADDGRQPEAADNGSVDAGSGDGGGGGGDGGGGGGGGGGGD